MLASSEGSILIYLLLNKILIINLIRYIYINNNNIYIYILYVISIINIYLYIYILLSNNIYSIYFNNNIIDGFELNPILQDPLLIIHPPIIFFGYSIFGILFCLSIIKL